MSVKPNIDNFLNDSIKKEAALPTVRKNGRVKKNDSLIDEFERLNKRFFSFAIAARILTLFIIILLTAFIFGFLANPALMTEFRRVSIVFSLTAILYSIVLPVVFRNIYKGILLQSIKDLKYFIFMQETLSSLPDNMKNEAEDFYIQQKYLTNIEHKVYFRSIYIEFFTYTLFIISSAGIYLYLNF